MGLNRFSSVFRKIEDSVIFFLIAIVSLFAMLDGILNRFTLFSIPGGDDYIHYMILWIALIGGMITSREGKHLSLAIGIDIIKDPFNSWIKTFNSFIAVTVTSALAWSSIPRIVRGVLKGSRFVGIIPMYFFLLILPIGFGIIAVRFIFSAPEKKASRYIAALGLVFGTAVALNPVLKAFGYLYGDINPLLDSITIVMKSFFSVSVRPLIILLIISGILGNPIFVVLGGAAYFLFAASPGASFENIPSEAVSLLTGRAVPAIPLFTLAGFILSESKSGERLVRFFEAWFGWLPGGIIIMAVLVSTFFTTFTGASGVTILALGGLLSVVLMKSGKYSRDFSTGLLTGAGSIGLLFPPGLPVIMYWVMAQTQEVHIELNHLFLGGLLPGIILVAAVSVMGIFMTSREKGKKMPFNLKEALSSGKGAVWEILFPFIILIGFFAGLVSIEGLGAIAVVYAVVVEVFIHKDIKLSELFSVVKKAVPVLGGILLIIGVSRGLSYYFVDEELPEMLVMFMEKNIESPIVFLILLNIVLLLTGCFMDIFSAIIIVAPLIIPLGQFYDINPVRLGVIFLANLGLGYLTPPIGLNLFLASYRFEQPLTKVYKNVMPFFIVLLIAVLLITYIPWLTEGIPGLF